MKLLLQLPSFYADSVGLLVASLDCTATPRSHVLLACVATLQQTLFTCNVKDQLNTGSQNVSIRGVKLLPSLDHDARTLHMMQLFVRTYLRPETRLGDARYEDVSCSRFVHN
ncbi:uncharacterized protein BDR25DRAFT_363997 [Lindgomyces ingoldianus]|uniref:Uncharacterized protein n=1 Tax=Lindgomyces ingoldianus TaxID=673940 RepID=A0ACB6Q6R0_9PLEO|nr:uncharacterized protein BDR25DRAFT_363997 [Lindgomyces ingoldianus]KAF2462513.1 hypothetical protein BDR25DRAFT_363997 [Lindgomyces ingoldianus]